MKVASLGEALIDFKGSGNLAFQGFPGGSPFNVAVACARLGTPTGFVSQLSTDLFGHRLVEHLETNGVDTSLVSRSDAPTTLSFIEGSRDRVRYAFHANGTADALFDPVPRPTLPESVEFLHFGSLALLHEPAAGAILDIVRGFTGKGVMLDPNVRPTLIADRTDFKRQLAQWISLSDVIKLSEEDLEWLEVGEGELAREWLGAGPRAVVVTAGGDGARVHLPENPPLTVPATPVPRPVDTVGAGDTFSGALLARFAELGRLPSGREEWRGALEFAGRAAAITCGREGADPPRAHEVHP